MAPRKRTASSRKTSQRNEPSEPAKFGIQHLFERHLSQTSGATQNPRPNSTSDSHSNPKSKSEPSSADQVPPPAELKVDDGFSEISPEASKKGPIKRFKFSPGMVRLSLPLKRFLVSFLIYQYWIERKILISQSWRTFLIKLKNFVLNIFFNWSSKLT